MYKAFDNMYFINYENVC